MKIAKRAIDTVSVNGSHPPDTSEVSPIVQEIIDYLNLLFPQDVDIQTYWKNEQLATESPDDTTQYFGHLATFENIHPTVEEFAKSIEEYYLDSDNQNSIFVRLGVVDKSFPLGKSVTKQDIQSVPCLWIDLDYSQGDKPDNPPMDLFFLPPTIIIDSGNGYHFYWVLDEPTDKLITVEQSNKLLAEIFDADSTGDVTRVLRIPGTWNYKDIENPTQAKIHSYPCGIAYKYSLPELIISLKSSELIARLFNYEIDENDDRSSQDFNALCALRKDCNFRLSTVIMLLDLNPDWSLGRKYADRGEKYLETQWKAINKTKTYKQIKFGPSKKKKSQSKRSKDTSTIIDLPPVDMPEVKKSSYSLDNRVDLRTFRLPQLLEKIILSSRESNEEKDYELIYNLFQQGLTPQNLIDICLSYPSESITTGGITYLQKVFTTAYSNLAHTPPEMTYVNDKGQKKVRKPKIDDYAKLFAYFGLKLRLDERDETVWVLENNEWKSLSSSMLRSLQADLSTFNMMNDRNELLIYLTKFASNSLYHPVKNYLESLEWDGKDHITSLCEHFRVSNPPVKYSDGTTRQPFEVYFTRWLIGAVARVYVDTQNPMLVLDGGQKVGKSNFVKWLSSNVGDKSVGLESSIDPKNKEHDRFLATKWIWEVAELDATTKHADISALKAFITKEIATFRIPYGTGFQDKRALSSFIGTVNNEQGFLKDTTGNRRFNVLTVRKIDWNYTKNIDLDQLWAQAVHLYKSGEPWQLTPCEEVYRDEGNKAYERERIYEVEITELFDINPKEEEWFISTVRIKEMIRSRYGITVIDQYLHSTLASMGIKRGKPYLKVGGKKKQVRGYYGIKPVPQKSSIKFVSN